MGTEHRPGPAEQMALDFLRRQGQGRGAGGGGRAGRRESGPLLCLLGSLRLPRRGRCSTCGRIRDTQGKPVYSGESPSGHWRLGSPQDSDARQQGTVGRTQDGCGGAGSAPGAEQLDRKVDPSRPSQGLGLQPTAPPAATQTNRASTS